MGTCKSHKEILALKPKLIKIDEINYKKILLGLFEFAYPTKSFLVLCSLIVVWWLGEKEIEEGKDWISRDLYGFFLYE